MNRLYNIRVLKVPLEKLVYKWTPYLISTSLNIDLHLKIDSMMENATSIITWFETQITYSKYSDLVFKLKRLNNFLRNVSINLKANNFLGGHSGHMCTLWVLSSVYTQLKLTPLLEKSLSKEQKLSKVKHYVSTVDRWCSDLWGKIKIKVASTVKNS